MIDGFQTQDLEMCLDYKSLEQWYKMLSICFQSWQLKLQSPVTKFCKEEFSEADFFFYIPRYVFIIYTFPLPPRPLH